jgi:hypothetical protein
MTTGESGLPGAWDEPDGETLDRLTRLAMFAGDAEAIKPGPPSRSFRDPVPETPHEHTRRVVRAALRMLLANGLVTPTPPAECPEYVVLDPPEE